MGGAAPQAQGGAPDRRSGSDAEGAGDCAAELRRKGSEGAAFAVLEGQRSVADKRLSVGGRERRSDERQANGRRRGKASFSLLWAALTHTPCRTP